MLTDLQMSEVFDSDIHVPPISTLDAIERVLEEVKLFKRSRDIEATMAMLQQAGFSNDAEGYGEGKLQIGIKKLLSVIEMARQEPEDIGARLVRALVGLGM